MEKPEKHEMKNQWKSQENTAMLQLEDSGNNQRVQPQWAPGLLACFPEILLFVTGFCFLSCPYSLCDSRQSLRCDGVWCLLSAAIRLLGIARGVSFRVRGQSSPHRAKQRLSAGRARDHPVMEIVPNKALSLSLSLLRVCMCVYTYI
jgi:hypothetical protein